jgi:hypothetical protein
MASYNSSSYNRIGYPRGVGVYPVWDVGTVTIASNTSFGSAAPDVVNICYIPPNSIITDFKIALPALDGGSGLGFKLVDSLTTPSTYISATTLAQAGGILTMALLTNSTTAATGFYTMGANYGNTARAIGTSGPLVKVWATGALLQLSCITSSTNTTGANALSITYMIEFTPAYDEGV